MKDKKEEKKLYDELIQSWKNKNIGKIQEIRKKINSSSRLLDNFYNTNLHSLPFICGKSKEKKYTFDGNGLAHVFNKDVVVKPIVNKTSIKEEKIIMYEEFKKTNNKN